MRANFYVNTGGGAACARARVRVSQILYLWYQLGFCNYSAGDYVIILKRHTSSGTFYARLCGNSELPFIDHT